MVSLRKLNGVVLFVIILGLSIVSNVLASIPAASEPSSGNKNDEVQPLWTKMLSKSVTVGTFYRENVSIITSCSGMYVFNIKDGSLLWGCPDLGCRLYVLDVYPAKLLIAGVISQSYPEGSCSDLGFPCLSLEFCQLLTEFYLRVNSVAKCAVALDSWPMGVMWEFAPRQDTSSRVILKSTTWIQKLVS